jgi:hypothetical protein
MSFGVWSHLIDHPLGREIALTYRLKGKLCRRRHAPSPSGVQFRTEVILANADFGARATSIGGVPSEAGITPSGPRVAILPRQHLAVCMSAVRGTLAVDEAEEAGPPLVISRPISSSVINAHGHCSTVNSGQSPETPLRL